MCAWKLSFERLSLRNLSKWVFSITAFSRVTRARENGRHMAAGEPSTAYIALSGEKSMIVISVSGESNDC